MNIMIEDRGEPFHNIWEKTVCFGSKLPEVLFSSLETIDLSFWKPKAKAGEAIAKESATPRCDSCDSNLWRLREIFRPAFVQVASRCKFDKEAKQEMHVQPRNLALEDAWIWLHSK